MLPGKGVGCHPYGALPIVNLAPPVGETSAFGRLCAPHQTGCAASIHIVRCVGDPASKLPIPLTKLPPIADRQGLCRLSGVVQPRKITTYRRQRRLNGPTGIVVAVQQDLDLDSFLYPRTAGSMFEPVFCVMVRTMWLFTAIIGPDGEALI